jgi:hypothetical protein
MPPAASLLASPPIDCVTLMSDALPDTLQSALGGAYRVKRELGGGGMSRVFVARDVGLDRDVVVKVLSEESTAGVSGDRFRREIQTIARLQHPHIVSILSAGEARGALYYLMPFVSGETLRARIARQGPFSIAEAVRIVREVLDALAFAHEHGVVHRDIKPENVLLEAGHAVVADFGIAKALRESGNMTSAGIALGTPTYMAPEQATADPATDHRADLYSVGVLAYELLTGSPPFAGSPQQVIAAHLTTPPASIRERRPDVPDGLARVVMKALAKEARERPQSAGEMLAALDAAVTPGHGTSTGPAARNPARRWAVAAAALLAVSATTVVAWRARAAAPLVKDGYELIAVMPLGAVSDSSLVRLGQDLVVTLSTNLDGVGALRTIDAATLLMRARTLPSPMPIAEAQALAADLGARSVLTGTLIMVGDSVQATVDLRGVGGDSLLERIVVKALPRDIAALTDSLSWKVLERVWNRGLPPSPVLTGLTTASFDALRAFLDGERRFQQDLNTDAALASYSRAFGLDSNFAQAYLRYDYVRSWSLQPPDAKAHARLLALRNKLPERDRLWVETRELGLPFPARNAKWQELVARFPDHPPILMAAADPLVHTGPLYGVSITEAGPLLERLDRLVPDHADTKFHRALLANIVGTEIEAAEALERAGRDGAGAMGATMGWMGLVMRAEASGQPMPPPSAAFEMARSVASEATSIQAFLPLIGMFGWNSLNYAYRLEVLTAARQAGIYSRDAEAATAYGEGLLRISQGDWEGGLRALQRLESTPLPLAMRLTGARQAAYGAWLGAVDATRADSIVRRARALGGVATNAVERADLIWLDGVVATTLGEASRVQSAIRDLTADTLNTSRHLARSLAGLWLHRSDPDAAGDSLQAVSDETMRQGGFSLTATVLDRFVVARSLRKAGQAAEVERYLMWPDAAVNTARSISATFVRPLVSFERGVAFEEAGNRERAAYYLRRFVRAYVNPPSAHRAMVDDAKARLARLESSDTPSQPKQVP